MRTILILSVLAVACADEKSSNESTDTQSPRSAQRVTPDRVTVDHILIGVQGRLPVQRSDADARALADDIVARLEAGEDWTALKNQFSEDPPVPGRAKGGPYSMDRNQAPRDMEKINAGWYSKADMAKSFGDVSFELEVGEIGIAEYDAQDSPFGYHIIKRIK